MTFSELSNKLSKELNTNVVLNEKGLAIEMDTALERKFYHIYVFNIVRQIIKFLKELDINDNDVYFKSYARVLHNLLVYMSYYVTLKDKDIILKEFKKNKFYLGFNNPEYLSFMEYISDFFGLLTLMDLLFEFAEYENVYNGKLSYIYFNKYNNDIRLYFNHNNKDWFTLDLRSYKDESYYRYKLEKYNFRYKFTKYSNSKSKECRELDFWNWDTELVDSIFEKSEEIRKFLYKNYNGFYIDVPIINKLKGELSYGKRF